MANVNDTNNTHGKLENQWQNLQEADIDDRDRQAIREFVRLERRGNQNHPPNTLKSDLSSLRCASKRAETPLIEMEMADYRSLLGTLTAPKSEGGYGLNPTGSGMYGYKRALKNFFAWLDSEKGYGSYEFADDIELPSQRTGRVDDNEMLTQEEIAELKEAANNPRDKALIDFLADTAARVSLASQLRVGDVYGLDTDRPYFKPNPNGIGHKGAPDKRYPILYCRAELREYLNRHHVGTRDEAPLWHVLRGYHRDTPGQGAMSGDRIRDMLRECRSRCDVDKKVNPHNFRHSAITRLSKSGHTPQQIEHIAGWSDDRMLKAYDHTTDEQRNDELRVKAGFIDETDSGASPPTPTTCGTCRALLNADERFCPRCGASVTSDAQDVADQFEDAVFESATRADTELVEALESFRELVNQHPVLRATMLDE